MCSTGMSTNKVIPFTAAGAKPIEHQTAVPATSPDVSASLCAAENKQEKPVEQPVDCGKTYAIMNDGSVGLLSATAEPPQDAVAFSAPEQLDALTANWPMRRFVDVWNRVPGQRRVARFENRSI